MAVMFKVGQNYSNDEDSINGDDDGEYEQCNNELSKQRNFETLGVLKSTRPMLITHSCPYIRHLNS